MLWSHALYRFHLCSYDNLATGFQEPIRIPVTDAIQDSLLVKRRNDNHSPYRNTEIIIRSVVWGCAGLIRHRTQQTTGPVRAPVWTLHNCLKAQNHRKPVYECCICSTFRHTLYGARVRNLPKNRTGLPCMPCDHAFLQDLHVTRAKYRSIVS